ncbi:hypothetical protein J3A83DRAFT_4188099 [Scleroderma citrinum]
MIQENSCGERQASENHDFKACFTQDWEYDNLAEYVRKTRFHIDGEQQGTTQKRVEADVSFWRFMLDRRQERAKLDTCAAACTLGDSWCNRLLYPTDIFLVHLPRAIVVVRLYIRDTQVTTCETLPSSSSLIISNDILGEIEGFNVKASLSSLLYYRWPTSLSVPRFNMQMQTCQSSSGILPDASELSAFSPTAEDDGDNLEILVGFSPTPCHVTTIRKLSPEDHEQDLAKSRPGKGVIANKVSALVTFTPDSTGMVENYIIKSTLMQSRNHIQMLWLVASRTPWMNAPRGGSIAKTKRLTTKIPAPEVLFQHLQLRSAPVCHSVGPRQMKKLGSVQLVIPMFSVQYIGMAGRSRSLKVKIQVRRSRALFVGRIGRLGHLVPDRDALNMPTGTGADVNMKHPPGMAWNGVSITNTIDTQSREWENGWSSGTSIPHESP